MREIRRQKPINGMSQKKLAEDMGVSPQYINKVIKGKENLTLETISRIESVLGTTLIEVPSFESSQVFSTEP
ncbi:MAG: helix-turn-helix transcriptional regulator [Bacteroidales bacterium]|nr:helix-turn-helix transcriptional regulator [Bacteroidales bacterium]